MRFCIHPNVGGVLIVGHGYEYIQPDKLASFAVYHGRPEASFFLQEIGGTNKGIAEGIRIVAEMLETLKGTMRCPMYADELVVGAKCGGSDFASGLTGNAVVGKFFEQLTALGGTVMIEEMAETVGLKDYLTSRCATESAVRDAAMTYDKTMAFGRKFGQYSISPVISSARRSAQ